MSQVTVTPATLGKRQYRPNYGATIVPLAKRRRTTYYRNYNPNLTKTIKNFRPPPGAEHKYHDVVEPISELQTAAAGGLPTYTMNDSLIEISEGDDITQRNGRKITVDQMTVRCYFGIDNNSDGVYSNTVKGNTWFRIIIFNDTQPNGAVVPLDVLLNTVTSDTSTNWLAFNNLDETGRFKILSDKFYKIISNSVVYDGSTYHSIGDSGVFKKTFKNLNMKVNYSASSGSIQHIRTNNIGMLVISSATNKSHHQFGARVRVRFYDY